MSKIRTTHAARQLRPVARERSREARLNAGDIVFYGGLCYGQVTLECVYPGKPYRPALLRGTSGMFFGSLAYAYPTRAEYEATDVHWQGPPKP